MSEQDLNQIIAMLEKAQDMIHRGKYSEANTLIYRAQIDAQHLKNMIRKNN